ncbi:MAG: SGNH/GDSL hydrolase family protein [Microthrixaceae bacterium]
MIVVGGVLLGGSGALARALSAGVPSGSILVILSSSVVAATGAVVLQPRADGRRVPSADPRRVGATIGAVAAWLGLGGAALGVGGVALATSTVKPTVMAAVWSAVASVAIGGAARLGERFDQPMPGAVVPLVLAQVAWLRAPAERTQLLWSCVAACLVGLHVAEPSLTPWLGRVVSLVATWTITSARWTVQRVWWSVRRVLGPVRRLGEGVALLVSNGLARSFAATAWALGVLPVWAASRAARVDPLSLGGETRATVWTRVPTGSGTAVDGDDRGPSRAGSGPVPVGTRIRRGRRRRRALVLVVVLVVPAVTYSVMFGWGGFLRTLRGPHALPATTYGHESEPWFTDYLPELERAMANGHADLSFGTRLGTSRGRYVNVVDGIRVGYTPTNPTLTVWYFGGSTMFGTGQRDGHTIPSVVARLAERDGIRIRSVNFGVPAQVNWIETLRFAEALHSRAPKPDLVVFYDGVNDAGTTYERTEFGNPDPDQSVRQAISDRERRALGRTFRSEHRRVVPAAMRVPLAAGQYRRGVELARWLAASEGVPVRHFWQPELATKRLSEADGILLRDSGIRAVDLHGIAAEYRSIMTRSGVDPIDLTRALDHETVPIYLDWGHTNERGARVVAEALYRALRGELKLLEFAKRR